MPTLPVRLPVPSIDYIHRVKKPLFPWLADPQTHWSRTMSRTYLSYTTDLSITPDDHQTVSWNAANIKLSNGYVGTIDSGNLGSISGTVYIYYTIGDTTLNNTADYSAAISYKNVLVATITSVGAGGMAQVYMMYGSIGGFATYRDNKDAKILALLGI